MTKYHLKEDGSPGICKAKPGNCPKASDDKHYSTPEAARAAFEKSMEVSLLDRFNKYPNPSAIDTEFQEKVARRRRVEDAVLQADPRKTVISAENNDIPREWDGRIKHGYYVHPEFRKALPDDEDFAYYIETVQLEDSLSDNEKYSAVVNYNEKNGLFTYSYKEERPMNVDW